MPRFRSLLSFAALAVLCAAGYAQQPGQSAPVPTSAVTPPPNSSEIAATVNGQPIPELAVYRALGHRVDPSKDLRKEVLNYLIDNILVDHYLDQMQVRVEPKLVEEQLQKVKGEIAAAGKNMDQFYKELFLTEPELRTQIQATLRWDQFVAKYGSDAKTLKDFFDANKAIFDGSSMRAKHILVSAPPGNAQAAEQAKAKSLYLKKQIEDQVARGLAAATKLDNLEMQKLRVKLVNDTFAAVAVKESNCPSKTSGGEIGWFPRNGGNRVPEPFAKAAFALKPLEISNPVATEFGYHLILCVDSKAGVEPKFEEIKEVVKDVYADKLRELVVARMRPTAKIVIAPLPQ